MADVQVPPEADLIRSRRASRSLSRYDVARRAGRGVSEASVRRYETAGPGTVRDAGMLARIAAGLGITPDELAQAGRDDAADELRAIMERAAADPAVARLAGQARDGGSGWAALMGEILAGFADIDAEGDLPESVKAGLREELIAGLTRDAAERRRQMRALRSITTPGA